MTKKYILAVAIFICFAFSTILLNSQIVPINVKEVFNNETLADTSLKEIKKEEEQYNIKIYYPETKYKNLNECIISKINKEQDFFLKEVEQLELPNNSGEKFSFNVTFNQYEYKSYIAFAFEVTVNLLRGTS